MLSALGDTVAAFAAHIADALAHAASRCGASREARSSTCASVPPNPSRFALAACRTGQPVSGAHWSRAAQEQAHLVGYRVVPVASVIVGQRNPARVSLDTLAFAVPLTYVKGTFAARVLRLEVQLHPTSSSGVVQVVTTTLPAGAAWLDAARYADSYGYQSDQLNTQWPYRDWVVQALNKNLPFDEFLTDQIAGDLQPGAVAHASDGGTTSGTRRCVRRG